jgi:uncharacterized membrane protein
MTIFDYPLKEILIVIISAMPIVELRAGIPIGIGAFHLNPITTLLLAIIGNAIPIIPLLLFLEPFFKKVATFSPILERMLGFILKKTRQRHSEKIDRYGAIGLFLFVAIPAPGTGVWTGCLLAYLFNIKFRYASICIFWGMLIAGIVVTAATNGVKIAASLVGWPAVLLLIGLTLLGWILWQFKLKPTATNSKNRQ